MSQANHISHEDLTLLALQLLPEKEHAEALAHLSQCDDCREEYARLQGDMAAFALGVDMHSPPAYARERLMKQVAKEKKFVPAKRPGVLDEEFGPVYTAPAKTSNVWTWSGWAVAAALAGVSVLQYTQRQNTESNLNAQIKQMETQSARAQEVLQTLTDSRSKQVGLRLTASEAGAAATKGPDAHAAYMADKGSLVFFASGLHPLQPYKTYELWLLPANGHEPIAAGIFKPDANGNANVVMPNLPKGVPAAGFGVTIEDEGGSKQPTLPIVMSGS